MNFYALRVSIVALEPQLFVNHRMSDDIEIFEGAIKWAVDNPPVNEGGKKTFALKVLIESCDGVMAGVFAKGQKLSGHDEDFLEFSVKDYPPLIWFWDREQQVVLLEKKTTVFPSAESAAKGISLTVNNLVLAEAGLRVDVEPVLNEVDQDFWSEYDKLEQVHSVSFELSPPNLFGSTEREMKAILSDAAEETNANRVKTSFENKDSTLHLKSDGFLKNLVNWCRKGGGSWQIKGVLAGGEKQKTTVNSDKTARIVHTDGETISELELKNYPPEEIVKIVQLCRPQYDYATSVEKN